MWERQFGNDGLTCCCVPEQQETFTYTRQAGSNLILSMVDGKERR